LIIIIIQIEKKKYSRKRIGNNNNFHISKILFADFQFFFSFLICFNCSIFVLFADLIYSFSAAEAAALWLTRDFWMSARAAAL
jgi:hypothetical protein